MRGPWTARRFLRTFAAPAVLTTLLAALASAASAAVPAAAVPKAGAPAAAMAQVGAPAVAMAEVGTRAAAVAAAGAPAAACQNWTGVQPPNPAQSDQNILSGVAVVSACDAWAVGRTGTGGIQKTLIEHWNGAKWARVPSPSPSSTRNALFGVYARSATDIWAVGQFTSNSTGQFRTLTERYDGTSWHVVPSPAGSLRGVRAVGANDAWAVGALGVQTLILHWNGSHWVRRSSPSPAAQNDLSGVAATSATNAWAVGTALSSDGIRTTLILRWDGSTWTQVPQTPSPGPADNELFGVGASSATNAYAVGFFSTGSAFKPLILHWNGSSWAQEGGADLPGTSLNGVAVTGTGNAWAVGGDTLQALLLHWDGQSWSRVTTPFAGDTQQLIAVAAKGASNLWAVGSINNFAQAFAIHCC